MTIEVRLRHRFVLPSPGAVTPFELDVELTVDRPGVTALFGPSGSGKSTVIDAVAGLLAPQLGRVTVGGRVLLDTEHGISVAPRRRRFGYVFQDARLFPHLSVHGNLLFGWKRAASRAPATEIDRMVEMLGLARLLDRRPRALSGGERQRVALGRALLSSPELLLLDEPLAALDDRRKREIMPYLERLRDEVGTPMLYVSHSIDEVARLAERIIVLDEGRVVASGDVFDIMSRIDLAPVTGRFEAGGVVAAELVAHDERLHLSELDLEGSRMLVPRLDAQPGAQVRVRIQARDITLSLDRPGRISANIVLPARVLAVRADPGAHADVQLACGERTRLIARLTRHSVERLEIEAGTEVFAIVKSVTVDRRALRGEI